MATDFFATTVTIPSGSTSTAWYSLSTGNYTNCYIREIGNAGTNTAINIAQNVINGNGQNVIFLKYNTDTSVKIPDNTNLFYQGTGPKAGAQTFSFAVSGDPIQAQITQPQQNVTVITASTITLSKNILYTDTDTLTFNFSNSNISKVSHSIELSCGNWTDTKNVSLGLSRYDQQISSDSAIFSNIASNQNQLTISYSVYTTFTDSDGDHKLLAGNGDLTLCLSENDNTRPDISKLSVDCKRSQVFKNSDQQNLPDTEIVQGFPITLTFSGAIPKKSSTITSYMITGNQTGIIDAVNGVATTSTDPISMSGNLSLDVVAIDSRGYRSENKTITLYAIPYQRPSLSGQNEAVRCLWDGNPSTDGRLCKLSLPVYPSNIPYNHQTYNRITSATVKCERNNSNDLISDELDIFPYYQISDDGNHIECILSVESIKAGDKNKQVLSDATNGTETSYESLALNNKGFALESSYKLIVKVTDAAGLSTETAVFLNTIPYTMHLQRGGLGVAFGKMSEENKAVEIASDWKLMLGQTPVTAAKLAKATTTSEGLMPQLNDDANKYLNGKGAWASIPTMTKATDSAAGTAGLVPAPSAGEANRYLRSDGTWAQPLTSSAFSGKTTQQVYDIIFPRGYIMWQWYDNNQTEGSRFYKGPQQIANELGVTATWDTYYFNPAITQQQPESWTALYAQAMRICVRVS